MDDVTAELVESALVATGGLGGVAATFQALTVRNTRGPSMHRIDRVPLKIGDRVDLVSVYVPVPSPSGVVVLLDRSTLEGGNDWATESLARRLAERTSCEVVSIDRQTEGVTALDVEQATHQAAALLRWCVVDRRNSDPATTTSLVVLGHGAGGLTAASLMSRDHFESAGAFVTAWILVSPALGCSAADLDAAELSSIDRQYWETVRSELSQQPDVEVEALVERAAGQTAPVVIHVGGDLDHTAPAATRFVRGLSAAGIPARASFYAEQINGFFSIMSIPTGERTLQAVIRTVRSSVLAAPRGDAANE
jgi:acetyl esterase/lipase